MKNINWIVLTLVIIGALNWGLIGFFGFDLVTSIFGGAFFWIARIIFAVVGLAGIYALTFYKVYHQHHHDDMVLGAILPRIR